jgi:hypothetical protein
MDDRGRTRKELIQKLEELRGRVAQPAAGKSRRKLPEESLRQGEETARIFMNATMNAALLMRPDGSLLALNEVSAPKLGGDLPTACRRQFHLGC